jgi:hypothetical protein
MLALTARLTVRRLSEAVRARELPPRPVTRRESNVRSWPDWKPLQASVRFRTPKRTRAS